MCFVVEMAYVGGACAPCDDAHRFVLYGLEFVEVGVGGKRCPAGAGVVEGCSDELFVEDGGGFFLLSEGCTR